MAPLIADLLYGMIWPQNLCGLACRINCLWLLDSTAVEHSGNVPENLMDLLPSFGGNFLIANFLSQCKLSVGLKVVRSLDEVDLIAQYEHFCFWSLIFPNEVDPTRNGFQAVFTRDINNDDTAICILNVAWNQRPKSLLSSRIPQLQSVRLVV